MKTLIYAILILLLLSAIGGGIYYLTTLDYSSVSENVDNTVTNISSWLSDNISEGVDYIMDLIN